MPWTLAKSEDVGDVGTMLVLATCVGVGVTGVLLFMFTQEALKQYAVLAALGATPRQLVGMVLVRAGWCAMIGTGLGLGACAVAGRVAVAGWDLPFRMAWFAPVAGGALVALVCVAAALMSLRPVLKPPPTIAFARR